jgi:hypothetical protein
METKKKAFDAVAESRKWREMFLQLPPVQRLPLARSQPHFDRARKSTRAF